MTIVVIVIFCLLCVGAIVVIQNYNKWFGDDKDRDLGFGSGNSAAYSPDYYPDDSIQGQNYNSETYAGVEGSVTHQPKQNAPMRELSPQNPMPPGWK
jgi:hypothetical protein